MKNITGVQWMAIALAILGVLSISTAQLTEIVGPTEAKIVVSIAGLASSALSSVIAVLSGQSNLIRAVQGMDGVESITVNAKANSTLAALAVDPAQPKIEATPQAEAAVAQTAREG